MDDDQTYGRLLRRARSYADSRRDDALEELIRRLTPGLLRIARRYRLGSDDELDVVQQAWLRLAQNLHAIREPDRVVGWLWTTVNREALRLVNRRRREVLPGTELFDEAAGPAPTAEEVAARADRDRILWRVVRLLPPRDRLLAELLAREPGTTCAQVARLIGVAPDSVSQLRTRCLRRLRRLLAKEGVTAANL